jgi:hypothetical protein
MSCITLQCNCPQNFHLNSPNIKKKSMTYNIVNLGPGLGLAQNSNTRYIVSGTNDHSYILFVIIQSFPLLTLLIT